MNYIHNPELQPVKDVILHRRSALMLDGVTEVNELDSSAEGFWKPEATHFDGHFDGMPVLPGIKQVESAAQLGGYLAVVTEERAILPVLKRIEMAEFESMVRPDDTLDLHVEVTDRDRREFKGYTTVKVGGVLACRATIVGTILPEKIARRMLEQS